MHARAATLALCLAAALAGCGRARAERDPYARARQRMVDEDIAGRDVRDPVVLAAMRRVPRHEFVSVDERARAYRDRPLPIGRGQTISQPYIVALMTELARIRRGQRVLEIGTGSGYQAAILAEVGAEVWSIEIDPVLARGARDVLLRLGYLATPGGRSGAGSVTVRTGDGFRGWPEHAPFDAVVVTAAPPSIPPPLLAQLAVGGRLVIPVGPRGQQELVVVTRTARGLERRRVVPVAFVPMTGEARRQGGARHPAKEVR